MSTDSLGEAIGAAISKTTAVGLPKPFGAPTVPPCAQDAKYGATVSNVCSPGFWSCFEPIVFYLLFVPFGIGVFTLCYYTLGLCKVFLIFYRGSQLRVCLESQKRFGLGHFEKCWNCLVFGEGINGFLHCAKDGCEMLGKIISCHCAYLEVRRGLRDIFGYQVDKGWNVVVKIDRVNLMGLGTTQGVTEMHF